MWYGLPFVVIPQRSQKASHTKLQGTKKKNKWQQTEECQKAFKHIKKLLITPVVLHMPMANGKFMLENDTSQVAAGGALFQFQQNQWVLIGCHSKKLIQAKQNYRTTQLELSGLVCNIHGFNQVLKHKYFW